VEAWSDEEGLSSGVWRLAYGKMAGKWGFFIEYLTEDLRAGHEDYESWLFKDAPREQRIKAVEKIPLLLEALVKKSTDVASDIEGKLSYAKSLASALPAPVVDKPQSEGR
jgi:hypothetical protein